MNKKPLTAKQRSERARHAAKMNTNRYKFTPEKAKEAGAKGHKFTPEEASEAAIKSWEKRRGKNKVS